jgi:hypothetical protein
MKDIIEGSKALLKETLDILGSSKNELVIVGGWGPYLRHLNEHPGTRDVDVLFPSSYSKASMMPILDRFLSKEFFIHAKHDFQLCRAYEVGNRTYIYNVDLLHPTEGKLNKVDFIDRMDLDVTVEGIKVKQIVTININYGKEIYSEKLFDQIDFQGHVFNVLDGAGIVLTKLDSCHNAKRERDIYDIYLSLNEPRTLEKLDHLRKIDPRLNNQLEIYRAELEKKWSQHENSLRLYGINDVNAKEKLKIQIDNI